jgi:hypothetical protein
MCRAVTWHDHPQLSRMTKVSEQQENVPAPRDDYSLAAMLDKWAYDASIEPEKIQLLWGIRKEYMEEVRRDRAEQARIEYNDVMAKASAKATQIERSKPNSFLNSRYAPLSAVDKALRPILEEFGIGLRFTAEESMDKNVVTVAAVTSYHGHEERVMLSSLPDRSGSGGGRNKTDVQALGSTVTYLRRYLTMLVFNLVPADDPTDDDGEGSRKQPPRQTWSRAGNPAPEKSPDPPEGRFAP